MAGGSTSVVILGGTPHLIAMCVETANGFMKMVLFMTALGLRGLRWPIANDRFPFQVAGLTVSNGKMEIGYTRIHCTMVPQCLVYMPSNSGLGITSPEIEERRSSHSAVGRIIKPVNAHAVSRSSAVTPYAHVSCHTGCGVPTSRAAVSPDRHM